VAWYFIDDRPEEAEAIAETLRGGPSGIDVRVISPSEARRQILSGELEPTGLLIDVDLSSIAGELGTGPGIAQDIRVGQKAGRLTEFPLVRFAWRERVVRNIGNDPVSDDLFDYKVQKEEARARTAEMQRVLVSLRDAYEALSQLNPQDAGGVVRLLGLDEARAREWGHPALFARLRSTRLAGVHVAAGALMNGLLLPDGVLIDEDLLAARLGVDRLRSGEAWTRLLPELRAFQYQGVGHAAFARWWSTALLTWWLDIRRSDESLMAFSAAERAEVLNGAFNLNLAPMVLPDGSAGSRPWARCAMAAEEMPARFIPVDQMEAVRLRPTFDVPPWIDPQFASLREALQAERTDSRLDQNDLAKLKRKHMARR
jgi:hypothetical protein